MMKMMLLSVVAAIQFVAGAETLDFVRTEERAVRPGDRPRVVQKTLIIPEWEPYYPDRNMLHLWQDRSLFTDTSLRRSKQPYAAWFRDVEIVRSVNLDGLGSLDYEGTHMDQLRLLKSTPHPEGYSQMVCISGYASFENAKRLIIKAAKSEFTTRVNGKVLVWTYNGTPEGCMKLADQLQADPAVPPIIFISNMPMMEIYRAFSPTSTIPKSVVEKQREEQVRAAKSFGGFQYWCTEFEQDPYGYYGMHHEPTGIWRDYLKPLAEELLAKPENREKLVGRYINNGYINKFVGWVQCENGTHSLRTNLNEIMPLNPDLLVPFEWNEENENTHFQPTVIHGKTWVRILNYYRALLDREEPKPFKDDDLSIPNLIVSFRRAVQLGETWHGELLYLPDGSKEKAFTAQLKLVDVKGNVLMTFPQETFKTDELLAINYRVPSERFAAEPALGVELETTYGGVTKTWRGFDSTRIRPTTCNDYLYAHHPLREVLEPVATAFEVRPAGAGAYDVQVAVEAKELLSSVEILDDLDEVAADDPENRYDRSKYAILRCRFDSVLSDHFGGGVKAYRTGTMRFPGLPSVEVVNPCMNWSGFSIQGHTNDIWRTTFQFGAFVAFCDVLVPLADLPRAKMVLDYPIAGHCEADLAECHRLGRKDFTLGGSVHLQVSRMDLLEDIPVPLNTKKSSFTARRISPNRFPAYQVRSITKSGKIWRSPIKFPRAHEAKKRELTVNSDTHRKPVTVAVPADAVPVLDYRFDPQYGSVLRSGWDANFDITLGGGGNYADPMHHGGASRFPKDFLRSDPVWLEEDGRMALRFDNGSYLAFPQEAIPHGSEFTLAFEIKPDDPDRYVLMRTRAVGSDDCGLELIVRDGTLHASYRGIVTWYMPDFDTGFKLPTKKWSAIKVVKTLKDITVSVNGQKKTFGYDRRAKLFSASVFGGNVTKGKNMPEGMSGFNGFLRSLRIVHAAE